MRSCFAVVVCVFLAAPAAVAPAQEAPAAGPSLAELPHWPIGLQLPQALAGDRPAAKGEPRADICVWLPEGAKQIRSVFIIPNNSDSKVFGQHEPLRKAAQKHLMAIVFMRYYDTGLEHRKTPPEGNRMQALMDFLAEKTKIAEFRHAPWITFGKSSRGEFPFRMGWAYPARTIASVTYHGETPTWPMLDWAKLNGETILQVIANGETEWGGTWYVHARPSLLNYRAKTAWLPHQVVVKDVGHGDYFDTHGTANFGQPVPPGVISVQRVWDYLALFIDKALALRVPTDKFPTEGPLQLKQVDESAGCVIDPFAVEEMFRVPRLPLREEGGAFVVGGGNEPPVSGFAAFAPLKDFVVPEGAPVVKYESGRSPSQWLLTDSLKFAMKADPMVELGHLQKLMPKPDDTVEIDGKTLTFRPIIPKYVGPNGGISLKTGLRPSNAKITLLAYTVLELAEKKSVMVQAGFTAATRIQVVVNGVPVRHKQVLELQPGRYPVLVVLRMTANWDRIEPSFADVSKENVNAARLMQAEADKRAAEEARIKAANPTSPEKLILKAADVPKEKRARMFWLADRELADAWIKLHTIPPAAKP